MFQQSHFTILLLSLFVQAPSLFSISLDSIKSLGLPVITIETVDGEEPACEYVDRVTNCSSIAGPMPKTAVECA